jgi:hypothetical protein
VGDHHPCHPTPRIRKGVASPPESKEKSLLKANSTVSRQEQEEVELHPIAEELSPSKSVDRSEDEDLLLSREEKEHAGRDP